MDSPKLEIREHTANAIIRERNAERVAQGRKPYESLITDQMSCWCDDVLVGWLNLGANPPGVVFLDDVTEQVQRGMEALAADIAKRDVVSSITPVWTDPDTGEENLSEDELDY